jgi:hypothetical protein
MNNTRCLPKRSAVLAITMLEAVMLGRVDWDFFHEHFQKLNTGFNKIYDIVFLELLENRKFLKSWR